MSDQTEEADRPVDADDLPQTSAAALAFALDGAREDPALGPHIAKFLTEQRALIADQRHHLREQLKRLAVATLDERLSVALKIVTGAIGLAVAAGLAIVIWSATEARGLVVEGFSAPPDFAQRGIDGNVVAEDMMGRLATIRRFAMVHSFSISNDVTKDGSDIKVEIPQTGVSMAEAWRLLRGWLGQEHHLTGSLRELDDGKIALTATLDGADAITLTGTPADLPNLEQRVAEEIFGRFDPVNITNYYTAGGRLAEAYASAARYVPIAVSRSARSDAYGLWAYTTAYATGDIRLAAARAHVGIDIDPDIAVVHVMAARMARFLGHNEEELRQDRTILALRNADQLPAHRGRGFFAMQTGATEDIARLSGDFMAAAGWECGHYCSLPEQLVSRAEFAARRHDAAGATALLAQAHASGAAENPDDAIARLWADVDVGAWRAAASDAKAAVAEFGASYRGASPKFIAAAQSATYQPLLAAIEAHLGEYAAAHHDIDATPGDCYDCVRIRGLIDGLQKNWDGAAYWFAAAVKQGPSIPFAYFDWGRMLKAKGDLDGAIAKFAVAHEKGPHFADPLEMWGEALILENRSGLARAKFEEAARYAPNWGRLHLKWGEALYWSGDASGAQRQFATAAGLELTAEERREAARFK